MVELIREDAELSRVSYEAMQAGLLVAIEAGCMYIKTSGKGAWENITVHPEDSSNVQYYYSQFVLSPDSGGRSSQWRGQIHRFEGVFRSQDWLHRAVQLDVEPTEIQLGDRLALRRIGGRLGTSLRVAELASGQDALDLLPEPLELSS